jgi:hypothetical protein
MSDEVTSPLDLASILAEHAEYNGYCVHPDCAWHSGATQSGPCPWPCLTYRLATLAQAQETALIKARSVLPLVVAWENQLIGRHTRSSSPTRRRLATVRAALAEPEPTNYQERQQP